MSAHALVRTAGTTLLYQAAFCAVSYLGRTDKLTDFAGTTNFLLLAIQTFLSSPSRAPRSALVTGFVAVWAVRLGAFLLSRILRWRRDRRLDAMRSDKRFLAIFWTLQAVWVWTVSLPVTLANASLRKPPLSGIDVAGWALFAAGFLIEAVADWQKSRHKATSDSWPRKGLWRLSRHPNYFGEMTLWLGIYVSSVSALRGLEHLAVVSPLFVGFLLMFVSGVPILERSADAKFGDDPDYLAYKRRTSVVVPCPPALYEALPNVVRKTVFFELGMYDNIGEREQLVEGESQ